MLVIHSITDGCIFGQLIPSAWRIVTGAPAAKQLFRKASESNVPWFFRNCTWLRKEYPCIVRVDRFLTFARRSSFNLEFRWTVFTVSDSGRTTLTTPESLTSTVWSLVCPDNESSPEIREHPLMDNVLKFGAAT